MLLSRGSAEGGSVLRLRTHLGRGLIRPLWFDLLTIMSLSNERKFSTHNSKLDMESRSPPDLKLKARALTSLGLFVLGARASR